MPVRGLYLAWQVRATLLPTVEVYGPCVLKDILPAFTNLEQRANEVAQREYDRLGALPASDDYDSGDAAEEAHARGVDFYMTMDAMRQATVNLFCAGLFHLVEQQLAHLCHDASFRRLKPPEIRLEEVRKWYSQHFRMDLSQLRHWAEIDELRLLANSVKHAEGSSEKQLRQRRPELFEHPLDRKLWPSLARRVQRPLRQPMAGEDLYVRDEQFEAYAVAVVDFFQALSEYFDDHGQDDFPPA